MEEFSSIFLGLIAFVAVLICYCFYVIAPYSKFPCCTLYWQVFIWVVNKQSVQQQFLKKIQELCKQYHKEGIFLIMETLTFVVFDAKAIKTILSEPEATAKAKQYSIFKILVGKSILCSAGQKWINRKKIIKPAFRRVELNLKDSDFYYFNEHSRKLVENLRNLENNTTDDINDILNILKDNTLPSFLESALGLEENNRFGTIFVQEFRENIKKLSETLVDSMLQSRLYLDFSMRILPEGRRRLQEMEELKNKARMVIESIKETASNNDTVEIEGSRAKSFGEVLLEAHLNNPSFSMDDLVQETILLIAAGYETTAVTCMWCLYLLGHNDAVQERLLKQLESLNENIDHEDLCNMEYLECIIKETLRIYPTIPAIGRSLNKDIQCGQYKIPKGSSIMIPLIVMHKNADLYPDPEKFDPERFRPKNNSSSESLYFAPFSEGIRPCLGKVYAMNQLKIMISNIIRNFKVVSLDCRENLETSWEVVLMPSKPLRIQFIPRNNLV